MKAFLVSVLGMILSFPVLATPITGVSLPGQYELSGNGGFLKYEITLTADQNADILQRTLDGTEFRCHGIYRLDEENGLFTSVYHCDADEVITQEFSLAGWSLEDLARGVPVSAHIKSSLGTDAEVAMDFRRK